MTTEWALIGLNIVFHQIAKLTSYAIEETDLSQTNRLYSVYFATPAICVIYNQRSKVVENISQ